MANWKLGKVLGNFKFYTFRNGRQIGTGRAGDIIRVEQEDSGSEEKNSVIGYA